MNEDDCDVNDAFDSIVLAEDRLRAAGYKEGLTDGRIIGEAEGFQLGVKQGTTIGMEIGSYSGFATTWLSVISSEDIQIKTYSNVVKLKTALEKFIELINTLNVDEPKTVDLNKLTEIRAKYKQVKSLLNVKSIEDGSKQSISF